jgi:hypothetical protein
LLAVKSGFILFIKNYQFPLQINTLERERERERKREKTERKQCFFFVKKNSRQKKKALGPGPRAPVPWCPGPGIPSKVSGREKEKQP